MARLVSTERRPSGRQHFGAVLGRPQTWLSLAGALAALGFGAVPGLAELKIDAPAAPPKRPETAASPAPCAPDMAAIDATFCVDQYEASTEELLGDGRVRPHSPFLPVRGLRVRALSRKGVVPQAYISRDEAEAACHEAGKRLCKDEEWLRACQGPARTRYPYGQERRANYCVDTGRVSPLEALFGSAGNDRYRWEPMNDPRLNQLRSTVALTASFRRCTNDFHVFDMVGNLHEWTADPEGTFRGGYYLDTIRNGEGCLYRTVAHGATYHDYSTGFRCCAELRGSSDVPGPGAAGH